MNCFFWLLFFSTDRFHVRYGEINSVRVPDQHEPWDVAADGVREEIKSNIGPIGGHGRCGSAKRDKKRGARFLYGSCSPFYFLHFLGGGARRTCAEPALGPDGRAIVECPGCPRGDSSFCSMKCLSEACRFHVCAGLRKVRTAIPTFLSDSISESDFNFSDCQGLWGRPKGGRRGRRVRRPSCPSKASDLHDPSCGRIYSRFRCCWIYFCCYFCCCWIYLFCCCCCCWIYFCTAPRCARYARQVRVSHMRARGLSFLPSVGPTGLSCLPSVGTFDGLQAGCDAPGGGCGDRGRIVPVLPSRPVPRSHPWDAGRWVAAR